MQTSLPLPFESVAALDRELARLARFSGALRLELGAGLEALARSGGHHELGFASLEAYALERCERSARWVQESRRLARALEGLPAVRRALMTGEISFSLAQILGKVACREDEATWLVKARQLTVRETRLLAKQAEGPRAQCGCGKDLGCEPETRTEDETESCAADEVDLAMLTVTVDREDAWLFECTRMLVRQLGGTRASETIEALLGEGTTALLSLVNREGVLSFDDSTEETAQRRWEEELSRWRKEAEQRCEARFRATIAGADAIETDSLPGFDCIHSVVFKGDATTIDARLRKVAADLSRRDLALGQAAEIFWKSDGWRRLGYATDAQYARERLGLSLSSIKAKRALGRRAEQMPPLAAALATGELGYEAARLVATVATPDTLQAWLERAVGRTVRFLREEVDAALLFARLTPEYRASPPSEETMQALALAESRIVSGAVFRTHSGVAAKADQGQMSAGHRDFGRVRQPSAVGRSLARVTLRFRVTAETRRYYRWLERLFERHGPRRVGFFRFLCCALLDAWSHALGSLGAYAEVYARDRYRCTSPVCGRRGVTPHHLKFRSAGGDDSAENLSSLCVWCHLEGIHGGRLQAAPPASDIDWVIGRTGHTVVHGRRRESRRGEDTAFEDRRASAAGASHDAARFRSVNTCFGRSPASPARA